jgi:CHAT domain-containing protein
MVSALACRPPEATARQEDTTAFRPGAELIRRSRFLDAANTYASARDSFLAIGDTVNGWYGQLWHVESMTRASRLDSAEAGLPRAYDLAGPDRRRLGHTHTVASKVFERRGNLDSALALAREAARLAAALGDLSLGFRAHDALGTALSLRGRYREALAADSTSLAQRQTLGLPDRIVAQGYNEVGIGYRHLGRYDDAVRVYEESFRLAARAGDTLGMALARANLANVRSDAGDADLAVALLLEASRYIEAIGHQRFIASFNNDIASHYRRAGRYSDARTHAQRAVDISRAARQPYSELTARLTLGEVELAEQGPDRARGHFAAVLTLADSLGFGMQRVGARIGLADAAIAAGQRASALPLAEGAVRIADSLADPAAQIEALQARARALESDRSRDAAAAFGAALDVLESMRGRLTLGDLRMGVGEPRYAVYEGAIRVNLALGRVDQALIISERARARELLELMADRRDSTGRLSSLKRRLRDAFESRSAVDQSPDADSLDREIERLTDSLRALEQRERVGAVARDAEQIRQLASSNRALLSFFWGERDVYAWWITADTIRAARVGAVPALLQAIDFLRGSIMTGAPAQLWREAGRRAFHDLIGPLGASLAGVRQLVVVPDGPLHQIPFELLVPDSGAPPLGVSLEISYGPSASVLAAIGQQPPGSWTHDLLAVGNPTLVASGAAGEAAGRGADGALPFAPLPYAETEARGIAELFGRRTNVLVGSRATVARWLSSEPARYRYLHFALHAVASDRRPERNGLLFAGRPLDLATIRQLRLGADLVTLSACETGVGRWLRGEGILGMQHAFLAAGARGVVVSLWRVADASAAEFMLEFYREVRAGRSPTASLAYVRSQWLASGGPRADPQRWAAFAYVGMPSS